jgi:hypothetical protein
MRRYIACLLAAGVLATLGGALFDVIYGGTTLTRAVAYAFWLVAAVALVLMGVAGSKRLARRFDLPFIEGWLFVAAAVVLTAVGVVVDLLGS